jgi:hypothetical protein
MPISYHWRCAVIQLGHLKKGAKNTEQRRVARYISETWHCREDWDTEIHLPMLIALGRAFIYKRFASKACGLVSCEMMKLIQSLNPCSRTDEPRLHTGRYTYG